jgi:O-methyltransferase involved in polyketide biosynthesis
MAVYIRAMESQRPDALIKDKKAVALVAQMSDEFARFEQIPMSDAIKVMRNLATREYDRQARDFLARHPDAVVVHIGCGLDSRFERVAERNGRVE